MTTWVLVIRAKEPAGRALWSIHLGNNSSVFICVRERDVPVGGKQAEDVGLWVGENAEQFGVRGEVSQQTELHLAEVWENMQHTSITLLTIHRWEQAVSVHINLTK